MREATTSTTAPRRPRRCLWPLAALLAMAVIWPASAGAETRSFLNLEGFGPSEVGGTLGPAGNYPGTVRVGGVGGTVTKVTLTVLGLGAFDDLDMALVGPNGSAVMLMSDACASYTSDQFWTFDDAAPVFVSSGSCPNGQRGSVRPTNYGDPEDDDLSAKGGPTGPFGNSLAVFNGISPNGDWNLFMVDDMDATVGFEMTGFALNLEIAPPPPPPVTLPGPTGHRAAALARCGKLKKATKQKTRLAKQRCRARARTLPL